MFSRACTWSPFVFRSVVNVAAAALLSIVAYAASSVSPVVTFAPPNFPESIRIDKEGNTYVSMLTTGEVRKITPDGTQSTLAGLGSGPTAFPGRRLTGLAPDAPGTAHAAPHHLPTTRAL